MTRPALRPLTRDETDTRLKTDGTHLYWDERRLRATNFGLEKWASVAAIFGAIVLALANSDRIAANLDKLLP